MPPIKIATPREFFDHVVEKDVSEFASQATDLRSAFHACISLLSLRDWIVHVYKNKHWTHSGTAQPIITGKRKFQQALNDIDVRCGIVTDIANASKHMVLDPSSGPNTNLWGNANTAVHFYGGPLGSAPLGVAPVGGTISVIKVKIDRNYHDVLDCARATHSIWKGLMKDNAW